MSIAANVSNVTAYNHIRIAPDMSRNEAERTKFAFQIKAVIDVQVVL